MKIHWAKPTRQLILLALLLLILASIPLVITGISVAQEGEIPDVPQTDDREAFPFIPVEPSKNPSQVVANTVLIIQDTLPWGYDSIQQILTRHGMGYDEINSIQIAATNLTPYELVIVPSVQGDAFYNNWNANIAKIESYVNAGGKLWQSVCNSSGDTEPQAPGGVVSATDGENFNEVINPLHPWMWGVPDQIFGNAANHDSLTNLYPGSSVLARTQNSGKAVVVEYAFGSGQVLLSGMTLEHGYVFHRNFKPILINSLTRMLGLNPIRALIIQDELPWGFPSIQNTLDRLDVRYDQVPSSSMATVDLRHYDTVIIPSVQGATYYNNWNANNAKFNSFINLGSKLWLSAANQSGSPEPLLPGGVVGASDSEDYNLVVEPSHPWVRGAPARMFGTSVNHDSFSNLVAGSIIVVKTENSQKPTLADYKYGNGRVMLNGLTLEFAHQFNWDAKPILENTLRDLLGIPLFTYVPLVGNKFCPDFGTHEIEPNNTVGQANGLLCFGKTYTGSPDDDSPGEERDWFKFYWDGNGTLNVDVTNFLTDAQVLLYHESDTSTFLDQGFGGNYHLTHDGSAGAGVYYVLVFAPASHPTGNGNYNLTVTEN